MQHLSEYINESMQIDEGLWSQLKSLFAKKTYIYRIKSRHSTKYYSLFNRIANEYRDRIQRSEDDKYSEFPGRRLIKILNNDQELLKEYLKMIKLRAAEEMSLDRVISDEEIQDFILKLIKIQHKNYRRDTFDDSMIELYSVEIFYQCLYTHKNIFDYYLDRYFEREKIKK